MAHLPVANTLIPFSRLYRASHQFLAAGEGGGYGRAHEAVDVLAGVEADGLYLVRVGLAVRHCGLLHRAVEDLADDVTVLLVHRDKLAFEDERQLVDDGRIHERALRHGETALRHLVGRLVAARDAEVVAGLHGVRRAEGHGEGLSRSNVRPRLVAGVDADRDLVLKRDPAPRGVHHVGRAVRAVGADHQHRHREHPVLLSKVLLHFVVPFLVFHKAVSHTSSHVGS